MTLQQIYRIYPKAVWLYTLILFLFIFRKTILNVTKEIGNYSADLDRSTFLAVIGILLSVCVLIKEKELFIQHYHKTQLFSNYYLFALASSIWAGGLFIIVFKTSEILASFFLILVIIARIGSWRKIIYYIIFLATAITVCDIIHYIIESGLGFYHTNGYTFTASIGLLLSLGCLKYGVFKFKTLRIYMFICLYALITGTSSASYISFIIGLFFLYSSGKEGVSIYKLILIGGLFAVIYIGLSEYIFQLVFYGKSEAAIMRGTGRLSIWEIAFKAWQKSPWLGNGFLIGERNLSSIGLSIKVVSAHNTFISVLVNTGIVGIALFFCFLVKWVRIIYRESVCRNKYACILLPVTMAILVNINAFPAIGSDWNYVAPCIYALIVFSFIKLNIGGLRI